MELMLEIDIKKLSRPITYQDKILLTGSCFTEHIGNALETLKFSVLQNPNGILFDPASVCSSLVSYIHNRQYEEEDLFQLNDIWHSWQHHSRFSNIRAKEAIQNINTSQSNAHQFLKKANWIIITLGSSFSYELVVPGANNAQQRQGVANCHRAPAQWFTKKLLSVSEIIAQWEDCYKQLMDFNPGLNFIFTISPVRHIRDGVVDNNRSKARLIEAVHYLADKYNNVNYFPAYELLIDILRDYRFYDIDLVHPNYMATEYVMEKFIGSCIHPDAIQLLEEIKKIVIAGKHKAFQPETKAHQQFLTTHFEKVKALQERYPFLDLKKELDYFNS
jgi:hypothetical protein